MTREEAEAYRKELMSERSVAVRQNNSSHFEVVSPPPSLRDMDLTHLRVTEIQYVVGGFYASTLLRLLLTPTPANTEQLGQTPALEW